MSKNYQNDLEETEMMNEGMGTEYLNLGGIDKEELSELENDRKEIDSMGKAYDKEVLKKLVEDIHGTDDNKKQAAIETLYVMVDGFIGYVVKKYFRAFAKDYYDDLYQTGALAMMEEIKKFDPERGTLTTFLTLPLIHAMSNFVNEETNRTTPYYAGIMNKIRNAQKYYDKINRTPTISDISLHTGLSYKSVEDGLKRILASNEWHYDEAEDDWDEKLDSHVLSPEDEFLRKEVTNTILRALNNLDPLDKEILLHRFGFYSPKDKKEESISYIAKIFNLPVSDISARIKRNILYLSHNEDLMGLVGHERRPEKRRYMNMSEFSFTPSETIVEFYSEVEEDNRKAEIRHRYSYNESLIKLA